MDIRAQEAVEGSKPHFEAVQSIGRVAVLRNGVPAFYAYLNVPVEDAFRMAEKIAKLLNEE